MFHSQLGPGPTWVLDIKILRDWVKALVSTALDQMLTLFPIF